jgi:serine protease
MKGRQGLVALLVAVGMSWGCAPALADAQAGRPVRGLIVKLKDAPLHAAARESAPSRRARGNVDLDAVRWQAVVKAMRRAPVAMRPVGAASQLMQFDRPLQADEARELAAELQRRPEVEWVVPNERERRLQAASPNDPFYAATLFDTGQWWLRSASGSDSNAIEQRLRGVPGFEPAWNSGIAGSRGSESVVVAVLDTGIITGSAAHPELAGKIVMGHDFVSDVEFSNDGGGRDADPSDPGDWVSSADLADPAFNGCELANSSWHGTLIAGQLAALTNNGQGVAGMGWSAKVLAVRVAGKCGADVTDIVDAIRWAAGLPVAGVPDNPNPARVINISFGGSAACNREYQQAIDDVWNAKGAIVVAAAGNEHAGLSRPASCDRALGVVALNRDGFKSNYSNFGTEAFIATVGGDDDGADSGRWSRFLADDGLLTIDNRGTRSPGTPDYARLFGTSFSAPIVAGAAALMLSVHPDLTAQQLVDGLKTTARPHVTSPKVGNCSWDNPGRCICTKTTCGAGILDAEQAVRYASAVRNAEVYTVPNWPAVVLDSAEIAQAVAFAPQDRDPNPAVPSPSGGGGGAVGAGWLVLLALAVVALGRQARLREAR